jgi:hypothetical protein
MYHNDIVLLGQTRRQSYRDRRITLFSPGQIVYSLAPGERLHRIPPGGLRAELQLHNITEQIAAEGTPWYDNRTSPHVVRGFPCAPLLPCDSEASILSPPEIPDGDTCGECPHRYRNMFHLCRIWDKFPLCPVPDGGRDFLKHYECLGVRNG